MKKRKWTWKASRRSIINISILLASFIIIILILVLGIRGIVRSAKASSESKKILAKVMSGKGKYRIFFLYCEAVCQGDPLWAHGALLGPGS